MDTAVTPDEHASNIATLVAVAGTPGARTRATPDNHYVLATVAVANGASTIVNADITDSRVQAKIDSDYIDASVSVTTKGDLQTYSTVPDRLPVGGNGQILSANSSKDTGLEWINGVTASSTTTFSNKRINPRIVTAASYTTDTGTALDVSTCDEFDVTAQAGALKLNNPSGTPVNGQKLIVRIKDNGTPRALTYDTQFRASTDLALPTTTVLSKTLYMGFVFNSADTKWDLLAVLNNI